jgi:hypothetical protein
MAAASTPRLYSMLFFVALLAFPWATEAAGCAAMYGQCGGIGYTVATCCASGSSCQYSNDYYSQCRPYTGKAACAATYGQCGGIGYTGATCCQSDWTCVYNSDYYSQCLPPVDSAQPGSASPTSSSPSACATNWGQCGGKGWTGPTCCTDNWPCVMQQGNEYYWQCLSPSSGQSFLRITMSFVC